MERLGDVRGGGSVAAYLLHYKYVLRDVCIWRDYPKGSSSVFGG